MESKKIVEQILDQTLNQKSETVCEKLNRNKITEKFTAAKMKKAMEKGNATLIMAAALAHGLVENPKQVIEWKGNPEDLSNEELRIAIKQCQKIIATLSGTVEEVGSGK